MSVHVISDVLRHSETQLGDRLVLIVLADHASADGTGAWPSVATIAHEARLDRRTAQRCLRNLEEAGAIERAGIHSSGTVIYSIVLQGGGNLPLGGGAVPRGGRHTAAGGAASTTLGGGAVPPEPSVTVNEPSSNRGGNGLAELRAAKAMRAMEPLKPRSTSNPQVPLTSPGAVEALLGKQEVRRERAEAREARAIQNGSIPR